jgi:hypothetical protein
MLRTAVASRFAVMSHGALPAAFWALSAQLEYELGGDLVHELAG